MRLLSRHPAAGKPLHRLHRPSRRQRRAILLPARRKRTAPRLSTLPIRANRAYLYHIPARPKVTGEAGGAQMVRVCEWAAGNRPIEVLFAPHARQSRPRSWDVSDPAAPTRASTVLSGLTTTHKNLVGMRHRRRLFVSWKKEDGWRSRGVKIYDLSDPAKPRFNSRLRSSRRRARLQGRRAAAAAARPDSPRQPRLLSATAAAPVARSKSSIATSS
jgi:hypothetical protein